MDLVDPIPDDHHLVVAILGKAGDESRKFYRWTEWRRIVDALDPIVTPYKFRRVESRRARVRVLGTTATGSTRITLDALPTGGARAWSLAANEMLATKWLTTGANDVRVQSNTVWCGPDRKAGATGWDVWFAAEDPSGTTDPFDQTARCFLSADARRRLGAHGIERLAGELVTAMHAVAAATTHRPWTAQRTDERGTTILDVLIDRWFWTAGSLAFREHPWAGWTAL